MLSTTEAIKSAETQYKFSQVLVSFGCRCLLWLSLGNLLSPRLESTTSELLQPRRYTDEILPYTMRPPVSCLIPAFSMNMIISIWRNLLLIINKPYYNNQLLLGFGSMWVVGAGG